MGGKGKKWDMRREAREGRGGKGKRGEGKEREFVPPGKKSCGRPWVYSDTA